MQSSSHTAAHHPIVALTLSLIALLLVSCEGRECGSSWAGDTTSCTSVVIAPLPQCNGDDAGLVDGCGESISATTPATAIDLNDHVIYNLQGLTPEEPHLITMTGPSPATTDISNGGYTATSDVSGDIFLATVVQNPHPSPGTYTITVDQTGTTPTAGVYTDTYEVADNARVICASDASGTPQASFITTDNVFAHVTQNGGTIADGGYDVYVRSDIQTALADGIGISGTKTTITMTSGVGNVNLGTFSVEGPYDVIVDINGDGLFQRATDLISRHARYHPCFSVQNTPGASIEQIAADRNGNRREIFDPNATAEAVRDLYGSVAPTERSAVTAPERGDFYVTSHQAAWAGGIASAAGSSTHRTPIQDETNAQGNWLLWNQQDFDTNYVSPGCFDVVIDTNRNGTYDAGTDYVDNIDHKGVNSTCGLRVADPACADVSITSHSDGQIVADTAIVFEGTIANYGAADTWDAAFITITAGTQTNTFEIDSSSFTGTSFSLNLPLFSGDNHITVWGVDDAGTATKESCAETITVTSSADLALFRAQLTWDDPGGSYDMDLHVTNPSGSYVNGGGGSGDCNYANCNVGLSGTGTNSIDWGDAGEADDPKLDVDCISNCSRIENIWMTEINENGDYNIYVDAFSGTGDNVTVTIFIRGSAVGQVNCGHLDSGSTPAPDPSPAPGINGGNTADSCFVGTISWAGTTGTFTPTATISNDF